VEVSGGLWDASYMSSDDTNITPLQKALRQAIADSGKARDYFDRLIQKRTGKTNKPIYDIDRGKSRNPSTQTLQLVADALGKPLSHFTNPSAALPALSKSPDAPPTQMLHANDDLVEVPVVDLRWSMGPGTTIDDYIEETPMRFSLDYIRGFTRTAPQLLRIGQGVGDSMFPTLWNSDEVWIDTTQRILNLNDRIWAISLFGAAAIKRLRTIGKGRVLVISDNPSVEDQEVDQEDLFIAGRVIRFEREV